MTHLFCDKKLYIDKDIIQSMFIMAKNSIFECGGILGSNKFNFITHFCQDTSGYYNRNLYIPSSIELGSVIKVWYDENISFIGIVHSHPEDFFQLSYADIHYASLVLEKFHWLEFIYMPIILISPQESKLLVYKVSHCNKIEKVKWDII